MNLTGLNATAKSIRSLSIDAIQKAKSGHPGLPLGCAELAALLYGEILKHNPADAKWADRDRFVLSAGHGSMLLYSVLHLVQNVRVILNTVRQKAWKTQAVRWVRVLRLQSVWQWQKQCLPQNTIPLHIKL